MNRLFLVPQPNHKPLDPIAILERAMRSTTKSAGYNRASHTLDYLRGTNKYASWCIFIEVDRSRERERLGWPEDCGCPDLGRII